MMGFKAMKIIKNCFLQSALLSSICGFALLSQIAQAEIYKSVDEDGKVIFSDQPAPQAEAIDIPKVNTTPAVKQRPAKPLNPTTATTNLYKTLSISSPQDQQIIPNGLIPFDVITQISPALNDEHELALSIDGKRYNTSRGQFTINGINRGPHQLQVNVIDAEGKTVKQSKAIKIFVYRPSN
jgi:hypothetical protein